MDEKNLCFYRLITRADLAALSEALDRLYMLASFPDKPIAREAFTEYTRMLDIITAVRGEYLLND